MEWAWRIHGKWPGGIWWQWFWAEQQMRSLGVVRDHGTFWELPGPGLGPDDARWVLSRTKLVLSFPQGSMHTAKAPDYQVPVNTPGIVLIVYTYSPSVSTELYFVDKEVVETRLDSGFPGFSYVFFRLLPHGILGSNLPTAWISWWSNDTVWVKTFGELGLNKPLKRKLQFVTMHW